MSRIGAAVALRTPHEVYEAAQEARRKLFIGTDGRVVPIDMQWMFDHLVAPIYGVKLIGLPESDPLLQGAYAVFDVHRKIVFVRQSVLLRSANEDADAIFTLCHELGHVCMHSDPMFYRLKSKRIYSSAMCDPEVQADRFAVEFLVDRKLLEQYDEPASAASYFRVPVREMKLFFNALRHEGVIVAKAQTLMDRSFENATQEGFDF